MTINSWSSEDPAEETKGGTGASTYAAGDILYASSSNTLSKLSKGSDAEVLTLASGLPSWATAGGSGSGLVFLASATASVSTSLDFASSIDSTYNLYLFVIDNLLQSGALDVLQIRTSSDGGSTYDSGSSDYSYSMTGSSGGDSQIDVDNVTNYGTSTYNMYLYSPSETTQTTMVLYGGRSGSVGSVSNEGIGIREESAIVDAVRFFLSAGTITSGTIKMYGMTTPS